MKYITLAVPSITHFYPFFVIKHPVSIFFLADLVDSEFDTIKFGRKRLLFAPIFGRCFLYPEPNSKKLVRRGGDLSMVEAVEFEFRGCLLGMVFVRSTYSRGREKERKNWIWHLQLTLLYQQVSLNTRIEK